MNSTTELTAQTTREKILQAAYELLEEGGLEMMGTRDIAKQASVNLALVNYHFKNKDELVMLAITRHLEEAKGLVASLLSQHSSDFTPVIKILLRKRKLLLSILSVLSTNSSNMTVLAKMIRAVQLEAARGLQVLHPEASLTDLHARVILLGSTLINPIVIAPALKEMLGLDLKKEADISFWGKSIGALVNASVTVTPQLRPTKSAPTNTKKQTTQAKTKVTQVTQTTQVTQGRKK